MSGNDFYNAERKRRLAEEIMREHDIAMETNSRKRSRSADRYRSHDAIAKYEYKTSRKRKKKSILVTVLAVALGLCFATFVILYIARFLSETAIKREESGFTNAQMKNDIYIDYSILGMKSPYSIRGKTKQQVYDEILGSYEWDLKIKNSNPELDIFVLPDVNQYEDDEENLKLYLTNDLIDAKGTSQKVVLENPYKDITIKPTKDTYDFPDILQDALKNQIDEIYDKYLYESSNKFRKSNVDKNADDFKADFVFNIAENNLMLEDNLNQLARLWNTKAAKGQIEGYNKESNEFIFGDNHKGYEIDIDELRTKIVNEVRKGNLKAELWTVLKSIDPVGESIKSKYKYISTYETSTTDNDIRNKNVDLACRAINGYILKPGQEFSFNNVVGERTEEKGYGYAPAYNNGEVVDELGGGVCQVSTTLYNAVFGAGLTTTQRRSHTFEPNYVTPGLDATVSWLGVDYKFVNDSEYSIGIKASYNKRICKVEIFSVPILEEGQVLYLSSRQIEEIDPPPISIIESGAASKGTKGSEWAVTKVLKTGNKIDSEVHDHYSKYIGHTPTAYEEYTYVDKEGVLQTRVFRQYGNGQSNKNTSSTSNNNGDSTKRTTRANRTNTQTTRGTTQTMPQPVTSETEAIPLPVSNASAVIVPGEGAVRPY